MFDCVYLQFTYYASIYKGLKIHDILQRDFFRFRYIQPWFRQIHLPGLDRFIPASIPVTGIPPPPPPESPVTKR